MQIARPVAIGSGASLWRFGRDGCDGCDWTFAQWQLREAFWTMHGRSLHGRKKKKIIGIAIEKFEN